MTARRYWIEEVDPRRYADERGSYRRVRVGGRGDGYGYWDVWDGETLERLPRAEVPP